MGVYPQPKVYPATGALPPGQAFGECVFRFMPSIRMCELRDPAYPAVRTTFPGSWCSTLRLNCCTMPCLKSRFCDCTFPGKVEGSPGAVKIGRKSRCTPQFCGFAEVAFPKGQPAPEKLSDSAK